MRRVVKIALYAAGTVFFALSAAFCGSGVPRMWAMRSKVDILTPSGAGLEYNEWVVNLTIGIAWRLSRLRWRSCWAG